MKPIGRSVGIFLWTLTLAGCGSGSFEALAPQTLDAMEELATVMKTVKDEATACAAFPQLKKNKDRLDAINGKIQKMNPDPERIREWYAKNQERTNAVTQKLHEEVVRLSGLPGGPKILNELVLR